MLARAFASACGRIGPLVVFATLASLSSPASAGGPESTEPTETTDTVPDSTLEALTGRQVEVAVTSGLSVQGELVGHDDETVTVIRTDGQLVVLQRADVTGLKVMNPTAPAQDPVPPETTPPAEHPATEPVPKVPPNPREMASLLRKGNVLPPCADQSSDDCQDAVAIGVAELRRQGRIRLITGSVLGGVGLVLVGVGTAMAVVNASAKKGASECVGEDCSEFTDRARRSAIIGPVTLVPGIFVLIAGVIVIPTATKRLRRAKEAEQRYQLGVAPGFDGRRASLSATLRF